STRTRDEDRDRHHQPDPEHEEDAENITAKRRGRQRHRARSSNHHTVRRAHENLAYVSDGDRQGEHQGRANLSKIGVQARRHRAGEKSSGGTAQKSRRLSDEPMNGATTPKVRNSHYGGWRSALQVQKKARCDCIGLLTSSSL